MVGRSIVKEKCTTAAAVYRSETLIATIVTQQRYRYIGEYKTKMEGPRQIRPEVRLSAVGSIFRSFREKLFSGRKVDRLSFPICVSPDR